MEWYLPGDDPADVRVLRRQIRAYLERHALPGSAVGDAELIVQELLANALEHAAGPVWVRLSWTREQPDLEVCDLGPGFTLPPGPQPAPDLQADGGRGLYLVGHLAPTFEVYARRGGGSRAVVELPVRRAPARSIDPTPEPGAPLPDLDEVGADGSFGRDAFLRALVVQLSLAIERVAGPDVGEDVVAEVGLAVGQQMEAAYRLVTVAAERLTPEQLADCFVRLKAAIGGGFYPIEITENRIVLGNTRCPFGDVVRRAPALCRMTSSVFGGIAARNHARGASVSLEERIAVGDPGCRVVVHLGPPPDDVEPFAHRYRHPARRF